MNLLRLSKFAAMFALTSVVHTTTANAQSTAFANLTIGIAQVAGLDYEHREKQHLEGSVGIGWRKQSKFSPIAAVYAGKLFDNFGHDLSCRLDANLQCVPDAPDFLYAGVATGVAVNSPITTMSLLAGPGIFNGSESLATRDRYPAVFGVLARAEIYFHTTKHLSFGGAFGTRMLPSFQNDQLFIHSLSTGVRFNW